MSDPKSARDRRATWAQVVEARLAAPPAVAVHGNAFQSAVFRQPHGAGTVWRAAVHVEGRGWAVLSVERDPQQPGALPQIRQVPVEEGCSLEQAAQHVLGWEALARAEKMSVAADGAAATLGLRHAKAFLAREGLVPNAAGIPVRVDRSSGLVLGGGSFGEDDIAMARRLAQPPPSPAAAGMKDLAQQHAGLVELGARRPPGYSDHPRSQHALAYDFIVALGNGNAAQAGWSLESGLSFADAGTHGDLDLPWGTLNALGQPGRTRAVKLLLDMGLPVPGETASALLTHAVGHGNTAAVALLAPRFPGFMLNDPKLLREAVRTPGVLGVLLEAGMPLDDMRCGIQSGWELLAAQSDDRSLAVALQRGLQPPAEGSGLVAYALNMKAPAAARRLIVSGYLDRQDAAGRLHSLRTAAERGEDAIASLMLSLRPDLAPAVDDALLDRLVSAPLVRTLETLGMEATKRMRQGMADALLRCGHAYAVDLGRRQELPLERTVNEAGEDAVRALLTTARADAAGAWVRALERPDSRPMTLMRAEGNGNAGSFAVSLRSPALVRAVLKSEREGDLRLMGQGNPSALQAAAAQGPAEMVRAVLEGLADHVVNWQDANGATALVLATRRGDIESVSLLLKAGALPSLEDKSGRNARDYARILGDEALVKLLETRPPVPPAPKPRRTIFGF